MNHLYTIFLSICLAIQTAQAQTTPNPGGSTQATVTPMTDSLAWFIQGPVNSGAGDIVVDQKGNIFVAGGFEDSAVFENSTLVAGGRADGFIARYSPTGKLQWIRQLRGPRVEIIFSMAIDQKGDIYCTGMFQESLQLGDTILKAGEEGAFLIKYAANGDLLWTRLIGKGGLDFGKSLALDRSGNVYVTGQVGDSFSMNEMLTGTMPRIRAFVAKYDSKGNLQWMQELGGDVSFGECIATDAKGDIYVGGNFRDTLLVGDSHPESLQPASKDTLVSMGTQDGFLIKLDARGRYQWAKRMGGRAPDAFTSVIVDKKGNVYTSGSFGNLKATFDTVPMVFEDQQQKPAFEMEEFIAKLDRKGKIQWMINKVPSGNLMSDRNLALDLDGTLYVAGTVHEKRRVVNQMVTSKGEVDAILTHFSPQGKLLDIRQHGGADTETAGGVHISLQGDIYVIGNFRKAIPEKDRQNYDYSKNRGFFVVKKYPAR